MMGVVSRHWILNFSVVAELYIILGRNLDCRRVVLVVEMKVGNGRRGDRDLMMALRVVCVFLPLFTSFFLYKKYIIYSHLSLSLSHFSFFFCIECSSFVSTFVSYYPLATESYVYKGTVISTYILLLCTLYIQLFLHT